MTRVADHRSTHVVRIQTMRAQCTHRTNQDILQQLSVDSNCQQAEQKNSICASRLSQTSEVSETPEVLILSAMFVEIKKDVVDQGTHLGRRISRESLRGYR